MSKGVCIDRADGHHAARRLEGLGVRQALHGIVAKGSPKAGGGSGLGLIRQASFNPMLLVMPL